MFGLPEALMSFIRRQVGLRTDTADANGSLHGKVENIANNILPTLQKPRGVAGAAGSFTTSQGSYQTALNVTGKGRLVLLRVEAGGTLAHVKITIDGNVISEGRGGGGGFFYPTETIYFTKNINTIVFDTTQNGGNPRHAEISFNTSLKLEIYSENGIYPVSLDWLYEIED